MNRDADLIYEDVRKLTLFFMGQNTSLCLSLYNQHHITQYELCNDLMSYAYEKMDGFNPIRSSFAHYLFVIYKSYILKKFQYSGAAKRKGLHIYIDDDSNAEDNYCYLDTLSFQKHNENNNDYLTDKEFIRYVCAYWLLNAGEYYAKNPKYARTTIKIMRVILGEAEIKNYNTFVAKDLGMSRQVFHNYLLTIRKRNTEIKQKYLKFGK